MSNIYNEIQDSNKSTQTSDPILISINLTDDSIGVMIDKVRTKLSNLPTSSPGAIYVISGYTLNLELALLLEYLQERDNPTTIYFRGIIHSDYVNLFNLDNVYFNMNASLYYNPYELALIFNKNERVFTEICKYFNKSLPIYPHTININKLNITTNFY